MNWPGENVPGEAGDLCMLGGLRGKRRTCIEQASPKATKGREIDMKVLERRGLPR